MNRVIIFKALWYCLRRIFLLVRKGGPQNFQPCTMFQEVNCLNFSEKKESQKYAKEVHHHKKLAITLLNGVPMTSNLSYNF